MVTLLQKRSLAATLPALMLIALLIIALAWPGGVRAAVQSAVSFAQRLWIGEHTSVEPIDPQEITVLEDGRLMMQGRVADESEEVNREAPPGAAWTHEIEVQAFNSIADAQAAVPFDLHQPRYLPEGYLFSRASVWGEGAAAPVNIHYDGPGGDLLFIQSSVGGESGKTVSIGLPDDYLVEAVQVRGEDATWAEHVLLWEADGFSYLLSSPNLSQVDAIRIAESLE